MIDKRIIVISDIHANVNAYKSALKKARELGFDLIINLGDLLTYGCDTKETIELTNQAVQKDNMVVIKGNHDQLYFDLKRGDFTYFKTLPTWIKDSISWTIENTNLENFEKLFNWLDHYKLDNTYFAHANPFEYGNWSYLNSNEKYIEAAHSLYGKQKSIGIFGHTHRRNISLISNNNVVKSMREQKIVYEIDLIKNLALIINLDSIGQPRGGSKPCTLLVLDIKENLFDIDFVEFNYDLNKHKESIYRASFSKETQKKIFSFF